MLNAIPSKRCAAALLVMFVLCGATAFAAGPTEVWLKINPVNAPPARAAMAMTYDPLSKKVVSFGGFDSSGSYYNDTWLFDGATWTQAATGSAPPVRAAAAITVDRVSGKLIMFGGFNGSQYLGDTWIWDGTTETWAEATPTHVPTAVTLPMMFVDPINGHAEMFGGFDGNFFQDITWQWTGSDWLELHPKTVAWARGAAVVANDYANKTVVMFGGIADLNPNNTWTWDGTNWTMQSPTTQPPSTFYSASAYDPILSEVIAFGGGLNGTWAWTGSDWVSVPTLHAPSLRWSLGMAYDSDRQQLIMYGGQNNATLLNGTYKLVKR
jgi:hypothetical protein